MTSNEKPVAGASVFAPADPMALTTDGWCCADLHFHTNCSDSFTALPQALRLAERRGTGMAVTDHNLVSAAAQAVRQDRVFIVPGMEISTTDGPHLLVYFYDARDLVSFWQTQIRPRLASCPWLALEDGPTARILDLLEGEPCLVGAAHPMGYLGNRKGVEVCIRHGLLSPAVAERLDFYEVICGGMTRKANKTALDAAQRYGLGRTGGTDGHLLSDLGHVVTAVRADDLEGFLNGILSGRTFVRGEEKNLLRKAETGSASCARFMEHLPSASYCQLQHVGRVLRRQR